MVKGLQLRWLGPLLERLVSVGDYLIRFTPVIMMCLAALWCGWQIALLLAPAVHGYRPMFSPSPLADSARVIDGHWFGVASVEPIVEQLAINVLGVYAPQRAVAESFAIVQEEGNHSVPLFPGSTTVGGWKVKRITASGVVLNLGQREQFVPLVPRMGGMLPAPQSEGALSHYPLPPLPEPIPSDAGAQK